MQPMLTLLPSGKAGRLEQLVDESALFAERSKVYPQRVVASCLDFRVNSPPLLLHRPALADAGFTQQGQTCSTRNRVEGHRIRVVVRPELAFRVRQIAVAGEIELSRPFAPEPLPPECPRSHMLSSSDHPYSTDQPFR